MPFSQNTGQSNDTMPPCCETGDVGSSQKETTKGFTSGRHKSEVDCEVLSDSESKFDLNSQAEICAKHSCIP